MKRRAAQMEARIAMLNRCAAGAPVSLNGKPALICGILNDFARVCQVGAPYVGADFSWAAVERVMAKGGEFKA